MIEGLIGGVIAIVAWELWRYFRGKATADDVTPTEVVSENSATPAGRSTKDIVIDTLRELQCDPICDKDGKSITFKFQGENIAINVNEGAAFAVIYDTFWYSFPTTDIETLSDVKRIVNDINWQYNATLAYTKDDSDNTFNVHTTYQLLCVDIPEFKDILYNCFNEFFHIQRVFLRRLDEASNKRRKE